MNAFIRKEVRLLLPNCAVGMTAALAVWLVPLKARLDSPVSAFLAGSPIAVACGMMLAMALDSFGREMSGGTFGSLLSQPVPRGQVWRMKTGLLAAGMALVGATLWFSFRAHFRVEGIPWMVAVCLAAAVYTGGLWSVLLLRQVSLAIWVTLLVPVTLLAALTPDFLLDKQLVVEFNRALVVPLLLYSIAGFWWARRLFLRAEETKWTGGTIALRSPRTLARGAPQRAWRPHAALFLREIMLHQSQWLVAGALAAAHLAVIALRGAPRFADGSVTRFVVERFWTLWLLLPVLLGCAAVAEDRSLGTLEGQLCLPVSRRTQFEIKFLVVLVLSLVFGAGMPLLLEGRPVLGLLDPSLPAEQLALSDPSHSVTNVSGSLMIQIFQGLAVSLPWIALFSFCAGLAAFSFYASTLSRGTFPALAPAALSFLLVPLVCWASMFPEDFVGYRLWRGPLIYLVGAPVMVLTLAIAAFRNYQQVVVTAKLVWNNLLAIGLAGGLVVAVTTDVYHRAWERFALEQSHGPALVTNRAPGSLHLNEAISGRLADGRIWSARLTTSPGSWLDFFSFGAAGPRPQPRLGAAQWSRGTNWVSLALEGPRAFAIQKDGSLWASQVDWVASPSGGWMPKPANQIKMERFGASLDWAQAVSLSDKILLLKRDGALWTLEPRSWRKAPWDLVTARAGAETNWSGVFPSLSWMALCGKADGSLWRPVLRPVAGGETNEPRFGIERFVRVLRTEAKMRGWCEFSRPDGGINTVGLGEDGTLRLWRGGPPGEESKDPSFEPPSVRLGTETDWVSASAFDSNLVAIKSDGSLWRWGMTSGVVNPAPERAGSHADWIGAQVFWNEFVSLAADGGLWVWPCPSALGHDADKPGLLPLLAPSRRPVLIGNIFAGNKGEARSE